MRRLALPALLGLLVIIGCDRGPTVVVIPQGQPTPAATTTPVVDTVRSPGLPQPELTAQERYDAAVWTAVTLLTDRKYPEALAALEQAQRVQDTEQIRREIVRIKNRLDTAKAADRTVHDLETVIAAGRADEAARLAAAALREYGDSDAADAIIRLKRQADALAAAGNISLIRADGLRQQAEEAAKANDLRAAVLAYEQVVVSGDVTAKSRLAELQANLTRYDDCRRRAAELRRDPAQLDDALATLKTAAVAWDTPGVRQEIADCTLALQSRRDRLGVAEFETRGDVGAPQFGRTIAEELLPAFKPRFDVVERGQIAKVCDDLKLQVADLIDQDNGRRELARLARVRYLVVGSVTRLGGITAHARLLDLNTGLVVQTAKVNAPTPETLVPLLPQLAAMLQMTDDQRIAYEGQLAQQATAIPVAQEIVTIPPPPAVVANPVAAPVIVTTTRPPDLGGVVIEDFRQLPPPGQVGVGIQLSLTDKHKVRLRGLSVALELGDDLFRRGRYAEAHAQFQIALGLSPGHAEILARIESCKPHLPPPAVVVQAPPVVRPRLALLAFAAGDPTLAPLCTWAAENVAPYLSPPYDLADRGEVYWYMGRLGVTLRDAVIDPLARLYLGRAMNVRFMVLGTVQQTPAGLQVVTHLLDTETGAELNTAAAVARDRGELKCRLGEIARWLLLSPADRQRLEAEAAQAQALLVQAEAAAKLSNFSLAVELTKQAGHKTPGIRVDVLLNQYDRQAQAAALEAQRRAEWEQQQALAAAAIRRQQELAEAARVAAAQQAVAAEAERRRQRDLACQQLLVQARAARDAQNLTVAIQLYDSALGIDRRDEVAREQVLVRAKLEEQNRVRAAQEVAAREVTLRKEREAELARAQAKLEAERQQRLVAEQARLQAQEQAGTRLRAEAEAATRQADLRAKADADARLRAEADARAREETRRAADAKMRADAEAKVRADAEARRKAEADAKARTDAQARLAAEQATREADTRRRQQEEQRRPIITQPPPPPPAPPRPPVVNPAIPPKPPTPPAAYTQQMQSGAFNEKQEKFADAVKAYKAALQIVPNDQAATRRADYAQHMDAGLNALKTGKKPDAAREFDAALKSVPNDPVATKWLQQARR
jgi:hypothetical protein